MNSGQITLFVDIGGVLLSNGWDHSIREMAIAKFGLDRGEFEDRHRLISGVYETGRITLGDYLEFTVFHRKREFAPGDFMAFMLELSSPDTRMIGLVRRIKAEYGLKIASLNNEGTELNIHRIKKFGLFEFIDLFISSCFIRMVKPDPAIYKTALDITQAKPEDSIYIEDRAPFIEIARSFGINGIEHRDFETTRGMLLDFLNRHKAA